MRIRIVSTLATALLAAALLSGGVAPDDAAASTNAERERVNCPERAASSPTAPAALDSCHRVRRCTPRGCKWVYVCYGSVADAEDPEIAIRP